LSFPPPESLAVSGLQASLTRVLQRLSLQEKGFLRKKGFAERSKGIREKMLSGNVERKKEKTYLCINPLLKSVAHYPFLKKRPVTGCISSKKGFAGGDPRAENPYLTYY